MAETASNTFKRVPVTKGTRAVKLEDDADRAEAVRVAKGETNSQQVNDPFKNMYATTETPSDLSILTPPASFQSMHRMVQENAMLRQCIEAMVTNVEGHGYRMVYVGPDGGEEKEGAQTQLENIEAFFDAPNDAYSMTDLRTRCRWDLETLGNAYIEVARNKKNEVTAMWHVPAQWVRITTVESEPVPVVMKLARRTGVVEQTVNKYFRRYVQMVGTKKVYFKEFGDPRKINPKNGLVDDALMHEETSTEIIHLRLYNPSSVYGLPRWFHQRPSILGSRQTELTNLEYFLDNATPAMIITVAGGSVDQTTMDALEEHIQAVRGRKAQNRIVLFEARGDEHAAAENGTIAPPKITIERLQGDRQNDAVFQEYEHDCHAKVRSAFRLPPIFVGLSEDYNYATAKTAFEVAESQVFGPERAVVDDVINRKVLATWGYADWEFKSNPPQISDPEEVIKAIEAFNTVGAMTPNVAIGMANEMFGLDIATIEDDWGNWPFEMVKSLGAAGRLKGMEDFVKEIETSGIDPVSGKPLPNKGKNPDAKDETATPYTGKTGTKKPSKPKDEKAQKTEEAMRAVREVMLELRNAVAHPEGPTESVVREDGSSFEVRKRARG